MKQDLKSVLLQELNCCNNARHYYIAFSGGADSTALLMLFDSLKQNNNLQFSAIHVNHQLNENSLLWEEHCTDICKKHGIQLITEKVDAREYRGHGPEAYARKLRYAVFKKYIREGEILVTAHNEDDLVETILIQLLRGSGIEGVAGIPRFRKFSKGHVIRPLLSVKKKQLEEYLLNLNIPWITDTSNSDLTLDRNYLRVKVLPLLEQRWPALSRVFRRSAENFTDTVILVDEIAKSDLELVLLKGVDNRIDITLLDQLSLARQNNLLRYWLKQNDVSQLTRGLINRIHNEIIKAGNDRMPEIFVSGKKITRYRDTIFLVDYVAEQDDVEYQWDHQDSLDLGFSRLTARQVIGAGVADKYINNKTISVCFRKGGEKIRLPGREGRHSLKKLFQESGIPPWERTLLPLIYIDGKLAAVCGHWTSADFIANDNENGWVFNLKQ